MRTLLLLSAVFVPTLAFAQEPPPTLVEATSAEEIWTLGEQEWDFAAIATVYKPVRGTLDDDTGTAVWTLEIGRPLTSAEAAAQGSVVGSPFKPVLLDEEKITLVQDARVRLTPISGRLGDRIRVTFQLPKADLSKVKLIRIEQRSPLGF